MKIENLEKWKFYEIKKKNEKIVEHEQQGMGRAEYGWGTVKNLSKKLNNQFGKGFSVENLDRMRFFYKTYGY